MHSICFPNLVLKYALHLFLEELNWRRRKKL